MSEMGGETSELVVVIEVVLSIDFVFSISRPDCKKGITVCESHMQSSPSFTQGVIFSSVSCPQV